MIASLICSLGAALLYAGTSLLPSPRSSSATPRDCPVTVRINNASDDSGFGFRRNGDFTSVPADSYVEIVLYPFGTNLDVDRSFTIEASDGYFVIPFFSNDYCTDDYFPTYGDYSSGVYLPWWEGSMEISFVVDSSPDEDRYYYFYETADFYVDAEHGHFDEVYVGQGAKSNYESGVDVGSSEGLTYSLALHNQSSVSLDVASAGSQYSAYLYHFYPLYANSSGVASATLYDMPWAAPTDFLSPLRSNVFRVYRPSGSYLSFKFRPAGSEVYYDLDCLNDGSSPLDPVCLPYWEGNVNLYVYVRSSAADGYVGRDTYFAIGKEYLSSVSCGSVYQRGYDNGFDDSTLVDNGVYFQWDTSVYNTDRVYNVTWSCDGVQLGSASLSYYNATCYFNRPHGDSYSFSITPNVSVPFTIRYGSTVDSTNWQVITSDLEVDGVVYLPFWEGSITLLVTPDDTANSSISSYDFALDNDAVSNVLIGYGYASGYANGYEAGKAAATLRAFLDGYDDGYDVGYDKGYDNGHDDGYDEGYDKGYDKGYEDGGGGDSTIEVVDFWGLFSGVVSMPFTFFSQGLNWTLFAGSDYQFNVSAFIGTLFVGLMLWKIISLIVGIWGGKV